MNFLERLIAEYCHAGVKYQKLKDVCEDFIVPMRDRPKVFNGMVPWCRIEDVEGNLIHGSKSGLMVSEEVIQNMNLKVMPTGTVIASCSASLGRYAITTQPLVTNQTFIGLICGNQLNNEFLRFILETKTGELTKSANTATIPYISRKKFEELVIPVPPMEVQLEVVRVLNTMTSLQAELQAELAARQKQYEFYRDSLLNFSNPSTPPREVDDIR